jgi:hypothetical protein
MAILFKTYRNFLLLATESVLVFTSSLCHVHLKCSLFLKRVKRMDIILHCLTIQSSVKSWQADSGLIWSSIAMDWSLIVTAVSEQERD